MAGRKGDAVGGEKQGSIEIAYVKLAGNDATLQEAVRAFNALINRPVSSGNVLSTVRRVNALPGAPPTTVPDGHERPAGQAEPIRVDDELTLDVERAAAPAASRVPRKYPVPTAITIDTTSDIPLSEFVSQYKLENDNDKYLALAAWLKQHRNQTSLKSGLIVTLYHAMDWTTQADVTMPLRRLASKKFQLLDHPSRGEYQISQMGEQHLGKLKA